MGSHRWIRWTIILAISLAVVLTATAVVVKAQADQRAQWARSGHANRTLAREEATVETRGAFAAHCGRCHAEQGFLAWLPQLNAGNPGLITQPGGAPADIRFLTNLGLTKFSVRPITCTTCHNADFSIRVTRSTAVLPSGFRAIGVGKGAQCMTCHNTRNGAITWNTNDPGRWTAPHVAAQADVIMGKNAFFVQPSDTNISPHATFIGDSCVTCHVRFNKESHTFKASTDVCARCHGASMTASRVQDGIETLLEEVGNAIGAKVLAARDRIATIRAWDPKTDKYTDNFRVDMDQVASVALSEIHGQIGLQLNLRAGGAWYSQLGDVKDATGKPVFPTSNIIVRSAWNYFLIHSDSSEGVHNPKFARTVLLATLDALK